MGREGHAVTLDRPAGRAGRQGLGFNGGQLLGLAIGGCFRNDLHYVAHETGIELLSLASDVTFGFAGEPMLATSAALQVSVEAAGDADCAALIRRAQETSTVSNSIARGIPVRIAASSN
jgi:organic hydroperoxide reductase OsmC/OhrA